MWYYSPNKPVMSTNAVKNQSRNQSIKTKIPSWLSCVPTRVSGKGKTNDQCKSTQTPRWCTQKNTFGRKRTYSSTSARWQLLPLVMARCKTEGIGTTVVCDVLCHLLPRGLASTGVPTGMDSDSLSQQFNLYSRNQNMSVRSNVSLAKDGGISAWLSSHLFRSIPVCARGYPYLWSASDGDHAE